VILDMLGWDRLRRIEIYRNDVIGKSSPYFSLSFFMARMAPVGSYKARYTVP
jgi:hypothetical protein